MNYYGNELRHELKYLISKKEYQILRNRIKYILKADANHVNDKGYHIRSLYFDDLNDSMYKDKEIGLLVRKKYRIRIYNKSDKYIRIERKNKFDKYISKDSYEITKDEFNKIMNNDFDFLLKKEEDFFKKIYIEFRCKLMRPKVIVDYMREAYISDFGNVRITFDKDLSGSNNIFDIFSPDVLTKGIIDKNRYIMEVKFDSFLPEHIKNLIQISSQDFVAVSKYVMCRDELDKYKNK